MAFAAAAAAVAAAKASGAQGTGSSDRLPAYGDPRSSMVSANELASLSSGTSSLSGGDFSRHLICPSGTHSGLLGPTSPPALNLVPVSEGSSVRQESSLHPAFAASSLSHSFPSSSSPNTTNSPSLSPSVAVVAASSSSSSSSPSSLSASVAAATSLCTTCTSEARNNEPSIPLGGENSLPLPGFMHESSFLPDSRALQSVSGPGIDLSTKHLNSPSTTTTIAATPTLSTTTAANASTINMLSCVPVSHVGSQNGAMVAAMAASLLIKPLPQGVPGLRRPPCQAFSGFHRPASPLGPTFEGTTGLSGRLETPKRHPGFISPKYEVSEQATS
ncbi:unnamed protein product [Protopolystoma xenopodis]|uniref:Uncharacterized protein n=1 Tax=Protopolystoma xenopodis TaxID=117903 RepID=A0A3S5FEH0_9PLAT|nr:unnamed protein product [Protopolystoma xenopodis]